MKTDSWVKVHLSGEGNQEQQNPGCTNEAVGNRLLTKKFLTCNAVVSILPGYRATCRKLTGVQRVLTS